MEKEVMGGVTWHAAAYATLHLALTDYALACRARATLLTPPIRGWDSTDLPSLLPDDVYHTYAPRSTLTAVPHCRWPLLTCAQFNRYRDYALHYA